MKNCISKLSLLLYMSVYASFAHANNNTSYWNIENIYDWQGYQAPTTGENAYGEWATYDLPVSQIKKKWLRVTSESQLETSDVDIWISLLGNDGRPFFRPLSSTCKNKPNFKECSNNGWVSNDATAVRVSIFWPKGTRKNRSEVKFYSAKSTRDLAVNIQRYKKLTNEIKKNYYLKDEVNWDLVYQAGYDVLKSPVDVDPIPRSILQVISMLPDASHMSFIQLQSKDKSVDATPEYPTCKDLGNSIWILDLPGTNYSVWNPWNDDNASRYVSSAHTCFQKPGVKKWIINLTTNSGGNADLMFSALYPIFGESKLVTYKGFPEDQNISIEQGRLLNNRKVVNQWDRDMKAYQGNVEFVINGQCASSCEAIAVAAKGRFKLLGQPTKGKTTSNMVLKLNKNLSMTLTHAIITNSNGVYSNKVSPDQKLSDNQIQDVLKNGTVID